MRITHVIRGDDHVNNTPRQINIFRALGLDAARLRARADGARRGRRQALEAARRGERHGLRGGGLPAGRDGQFPRAHRLGARRRRDLLPRRSSSQWFDLPGISPAPSRFNASKLNWVNQEHMKRMSGGGIRPAARAVPRSVPDSIRRAARMPARSPRCCATGPRRWSRWPTRRGISTRRRRCPPEKVAEQVTDANRAALAELHAEFATLAWTARGAGRRDEGGGRAARHQAAADHDADALLVAGTPSTPAIDAVLALLGRDTARSRMAAGLGL